MTEVETEADRQVLDESQESTESRDSHHRFEIDQSESVSEFEAEVEAEIVFATFLSQICHKFVVHLACPDILSSFYIRRILVIYWGSHVLHLKT